jgi:iron complex outermembrane recepter protein
MKFYIIFAILSVKSLLFSQVDCKINIEGRIIDNHHEEEGLEYATVFIEELGRGVEADIDGKYKILGLCPGNYHLISSHVGCETKKTYISITKDTIINFLLEHHTNLLDEISISEVKSKAGISLFQYTINGQTLNNLQGKDLAQIASYVPGVSILKTGSGISKPIINGLSSNRIAIVNQGIPLESQQWGNDHAPEIDVFQAQSISVIKGSAAVKYGVNAMAGVIIIESNRIDDDPHVHGDFTNIYQTNGRGISSNLKLEQKTKFLKYRCSANFKKKGDASSPNYYLTNTGISEWNLSSYLTNDDLKSKWQRSFYTSYFKTNIAILRSSHIGNLTDLQEAYKRTIPFFTNNTFSYQINNPRQDVGHFLAKFQNKYFIKESISLHLDASFQNNIRKEFDIRRGNRSDRPILNMALNNGWVDAYMNLESAKFKTQIGLQNKITQNTNVVGTGVSPLIPNYLQTTNSIYLSSNTDLKIFKVEAGLRLDIQKLKVKYIENGQLVSNEHAGSNYCANIGLLRKFSESYQLKLNVGYVRRLPFVNELYSGGLHQGLASIEQGNKFLKNEVALKIITDHKINFSEHSQLNLSMYYHRFNGYIYLRPQLEPRLTIRGAFPVFNYAQEDALLKGLDFVYSQEIFHKHEWMIKASLIDAKNIDTKENLVFIPPMMVSTGFNYKWATLVKLKNVVANINVAYTGKKNNISIEDDIVPSPAAYTLINLSLGADTKLFGKETNFSISVDNLLDTEYRDYLNRLRYFSADVGRNINIKCKFNL